MVFAQRPDGKAREILGIDADLCSQASSRRTQVEHRTEELVADYIERHGHEPSPEARKRISQHAVFDTRKAKDSTSPEEQIAQWSGQRRRQVLETLEKVRTSSADVALYGHPDAANLPDQRYRSTILTQAIADVQRQYSTWTIGNLMAAIEANLASNSPYRGHVEELAREALRTSNDYGVLTVTAPELVATPDALRRADGRSQYRPHIDER
ncbi:relaxase domain-containing protein, partial [Actinopolyspora erythraea]|uniref:relaxase domain-containing protein n=1 Tax=Actinopolyspora erythraea TaxID=414996 RepID=UPI0005BB340F